MSTKSSKPRKDRIKVGSDGGDKHSNTRFDGRNEFDNSEIGGNEVKDNKIVKEKSYHKT